MRGDCSQEGVGEYQVSAKVCFVPNLTDGRETHDLHRQSQRTVAQVTIHKISLSSIVKV